MYFEVKPKQENLWKDGDLCYWWQRLQGRFIFCPIVLLTVILRPGNCGCVESRGHGEYLRYGELKDVRIWAWQ